MFPHAWLDFSSGGCGRDLCGGDPCASHSWVHPFLKPVWATTTHQSCRQAGRRSHSTAAQTYFRKTSSIPSRRCTENTFRGDTWRQRELWRHGHNPGRKSSMLKRGSLWFIGNPEWARTALVGLWQGVSNTVANRQNSKRHKGQRKISKKDRWPKEHQ